MRLPVSASQRIVVSRSPRIYNQRNKLLLAAPILIGGLFVLAVLLFREKPPSVESNQDQQPPNVIQTPNDLEESTKRQVKETRLLLQEVRENLRESRQRYAELKEKQDEKWEKLKGADWKILLDEGHMTLEDYEFLMSIKKNSTSNSPKRAAPHTSQDRTRRQ